MKAAREYSADEVSLFAEWRPVRMECRPKKCNGGARCWAEVGPPALSKNYGCAGCGGFPRSRQVSLADAR